MQNKCRKEVVTITKITYNKNDTKRKRKIIRIQGYDYSKEGLYFITICTEGRKEILSKINTETKYYIHRQNRDNNVGADDPVRPQLKIIGKKDNTRIKINNNERMLEI